MKQKYGFALGGGGAKAFTQLGAMRELEKHKIKPSILAGTSMGAVNAVLYSAGYTVDEIINFYAQSDILDMFGVKPSIKGLLSNKKLGLLVERLCNLKGIYKLEDLLYPTYVVTTDAKTNKTVTLKSGSIKFAIMATTSTLFFNPVKHENNMLLKDGCYTRNVPYDALSEIIKDKKLSGNYYFYAFDVIPTYKAGLLIPLNNFDKKVYINDRARKINFENKYFGTYLDLHNDINRTSFNKKSLQKGIEYGENYIKTLYEKQEEYTV